MTETDKAILAELSRRDLMDCTKLAVKELIAEQAVIFGFWSFKALSAVVLGALLIVALWANGYIKH